MKCSTGPTKLYPATAQCNRKANQIIFGKLYCSKCADKLRKLHYQVTMK